MSNAIISGWDAAMQPLAEVTWPNKVEYAGFHGYETRKLRGGNLGGWSKQQALNVFLRDHEWVLLADLDVFIYNMTIRLEDFIERCPPETDLILTTDAHGLNCGMMLWRNSHWSRGFAERIFRRPGHWASSSFEQPVISHLLFAEPKEKWHVLPQRAFNSYCYGFYQHFFPAGYPEGEYQQGDFAIHLPGISNDARIRFFVENTFRVERPGLTRVPSAVAMDAAHVALIHGFVVSLKPQRVLELGLGSGFLTRSLVTALRFNQCGRLTTVDNWHDAGGVRSPLADQFEQMGVEVVTADEGDYIRLAPDEAFDVIVSDADHQTSDQFVGDHLRALRPGGAVFYHDVSMGYPNLATIRDTLAARGVWCKVFNVSSRPDERCNRGLLMGVKP